MIEIPYRNGTLVVHPVSQYELDTVLRVYEQCEDFLALGPVTKASLEMVTDDIELSKSEGGFFCGIYTEVGKMIGVIDYVPSHYKGNPCHAYLELLMIAAPYRGQGIGKVVVDAVENEIKKDTRVSAILAGVQVNNPQAMRFWQRNGYRIVSEPKLYPDQIMAVDLWKDLLTED